jgi:ABC-2 type transport system permease protein
MAMMPGRDGVVRDIDEMLVWARQALHDGHHSDIAKHLDAAATLLEQIEQPAAAASVRALRSGIDGPPLNDHETAFYTALVDEQLQLLAREANGAAVIWPTELPQTLEELKERVAVGVLGDALGSRWVWRARRSASGRSLTPPRTSRRPSPCWRTPVTRAPPGYVPCTAISTSASVIMHADGRRRVRDLLQAPWQRERVAEPQLQPRWHVVVSALQQGELLKLRTTRTFTALTTVAAGTSLLLIVLDTTLFREHFDETTVRQLFTSEITGLFILVLGVMGMTGEWRHRTITSSVLAAPDRLRLLDAKLTSYAIAGALLSLIVTVMIMLVGTIILSLRNKTTLDIAALLDVLWRNLTVAAYYGAIGVCLGALLRNQAAALVGVLMVCFIVEPTLLEQVPKIGRLAPLVVAPDGLVRYDPTDAEGLPGGDDALQPAISGVVMLGWLAALYAIAGVLLRRRDLT